MMSQAGAACREAEMKATPPLGTEATNIETTHQAEEFKLHRSNPGCAWHFLHQPSQTKMVAQNYAKTNAIGCISQY